MTYGDGVANVEIDKEIEFHKEKKVYATMAAVQPPGRYGHVEIKNDIVTSFQEKTQGDGGWINGGFFIIEPEIFDFIEGDSITWERAPLENLARGNHLAAWHHRGFWRPMDTLRDKVQLEELWESGRAPWKIWK